MVINRPVLMRIPAWVGKTWPLVYWGLVAAAIALAFSNWVYDDPFITYRYAANLAKGWGFSYNSGQPALSVTSPLFTLLLAGGYWLGFEPHRLAVLLGAASIAAGAWLLWQIGQSMKSPAVGWVGLLFYPTFPLLLTTLSSETPLYLALCLGAIAAYLNEHPLLTAVLSALACLARPDGCLVPIALLIHAYLNKRPFSWKAGVAFLLILAPWLLFASYAFGDPIPLTLFAKQAQGALLNSQDFIEGFWALVKSYAHQWQWPVKFIIALLGLLPLLKRSKSWSFLIVWSSLYFLGFSLLGVSAYFWYYAPLIPFFLALSGLGLESLLQKLQTAYPNNNRIASQVALLLVSILLFADLNGLLILRQQKDERFEIYQAVGIWLQQNTPEKSLIAALEIGILGYYAQRPIVDFAGLLQPEIARQLPGAQGYETAALYTVDQFHPDYVVLHQNLYPRLEDRLAEIACTPVHFLSGEDYNYSREMVIMQCNLP